MEEKQEVEDKPILIYMKHAEPKTHKMIIPKTFIEQYGLDFTMEIYRNKIILKPIEKE